MKNLFVATFVLGMLHAADSEKKMKMQDLPPAVQEAVKQQQSQGATLRGLAKEVENGKTSYEAELTVDGHARDISFDASGKVLATEDVVALDSIPAPAREALKKAAGTGTIKLVESVTENGTKFFEAQIKKGLKSSEVKVDADGKPVK